MSWSIGPRYNGTRLHFLFFNVCRNWIAWECDDKYDGFDIIVIEKWICFQSEGSDLFGNSASEKEDDFGGSESEEDEETETKVEWHNM